MYSNNRQGKKEEEKSRNFFPLPASLPQKDFNTEGVRGPPHGKLNIFFCFREPIPSVI